LIISPSDTVPNSWCFAFLFKSPGSSLNIYSQVGLVTLGTLFTLFVIPSIYMLIARDRGKDRERDIRIAPES